MTAPGTAAPLEGLSAERIDTIHALYAEQHRADTAGLWAERGSDDAASDDALLDACDAAANAINEQVKAAEIAAICAMASKVLTMSSALTTAALQFEFYARQHDAKGTAESSAKADVNRQMARLMKAALTTVNNFGADSPNGQESFLQMSLTVEGRAAQLHMLNGQAQRLEAVPWNEMNDGVKVFWRQRARAQIAAPAEASSNG